MGSTEIFQHLLMMSIKPSQLLLMHTHEIRSFFKTIPHLPVVLYGYPLHHIFVLIYNLNHCSFTFGLLYYLKLTLCFSLILCPVLHLPYLVRIFLRRRQESFLDDIQLGKGCCCRFFGFGRKQQTLILHIKEYAILLLVSHELHGQLINLLVLGIQFLVLILDFVPHWLLMLCCVIGGFVGRKGSSILNIVCRRGSRCLNAHSIQKILFNRSRDWKVRGSCTSPSILGITALYTYIDAVFLPPFLGRWWQAWTKNSMQNCIPIHSNTNFGKIHYWQKFSKQKSLSMMGTWFLYLLNLFSILVQQNGDAFFPLNNEGPKIWRSLLHCIV